MEKMSKFDITEVKGILGFDNDQNLGFVRITPEIAEQLLKYNKHNRPMQSTRVKEYANDMEHGKWCLSESVIGFGNDGVLTNGQTRLQACIQSNTSFQSIVCTCLEQNIHMDTGNTRRVVANIMLNGEVDSYINPNANSLKTVLEVIRISNNKQRVTAEPVVEFCKRYGYYIDSAYNNGLLTLQGSERGLFRVQIAAAFLAATMNHVDKTALMRIRTVLTSGMTSDPSEEIIIRWRTQLIKLSSGIGSQSAVNTKQIYLGTQHVIYCISNNKKTKSILTDKEYYPAL